MKEKRGKLILIDGSSLLSTNFYGTLPREWHGGNKDVARQLMMKTSEGIFTNGVFGMMKTILSVIKNQAPTHLAVAWDINRNTFRREYYPEYKANRGETPIELKSQFPLAQEILGELGIKQYSFEKYEADDIIGTLTKKFEEELPVYIMTKDQDALQLISENTRVWLNTSTTSKKLVEYFGEDFDRRRYNVPVNHFEFTISTMPFFYGGLSPKQIIDLKGLEGDPSDNIPGVKGCGIKSIYPLLQEFKDIEGVYEFIENNTRKDITDMFKSIGIKRSPLNSLIKEPTEEGELCGKAAALISKELATINTTMVQLQNVQSSDMRMNLNLKNGVDALRKYQFMSLLREVEEISRKHMFEKALTGA